MNIFKISKEIQHINKIITNLQTDNNKINCNLNNLNTNMVNIEINYPSQKEIISYLDEIKSDINNLNLKLESITNKEFIDKSKIFNENEVTHFLKSINIEEKYINIINFLNYKTIEELLLVDNEELELYKFPKTLIELILCKAQNYIK